MTTIDDFIVIRAPAGEDQAEALRDEVLMEAALRAIAAQYTKRRPKAVLLEQPVWLITNDWREAEAFELHHDCDSCRDGKAKAVAALKENPDDLIALGNLRYEEVW